MLHDENEIIQEEYNTLQSTYNVLLEEQKSVKSKEIEEFEILCDQIDQQNLES